MSDKVTIMIIFALVIFIIQLFGYIPVYLIWKRDCKTIGRERLAVPLSDRTMNYILICLMAWFGFLLNRSIWE